MCATLHLEADYLIAESFFTLWEEAFSTLRFAGSDRFQTLRKGLSVVDKSRGVIRGLIRWRYLIQTHRTIRGVSTVAVRGTLIDLLSDCCFRDCTDPGDHIFALSGFFEEENQVGLVDYSLSVEETYLTFARSCILHANFQILCYAGIGYVDNLQPSTLRLPSWTPNWGSEGIRSWPDIVPFLYSDYSAGKMTGRTVIGPSNSSDATKISFQGIVCDTIVQVLEGLSHWEDPEDVRWKDLLFRQGRGTNYINGIPLLQAYLRTLLADIDRLRNIRIGVLYRIREEENDPVMAIHGGFIIHFLEQYCIDNEPISSIEKDKLKAELRATGDVLSLNMGSFFHEVRRPSSERWSQWLQNASKHKEAFALTRKHYGSKGRNFFTTSQGYMGIAPPYTKKGDLVCVFQNVNVPFILRKDAQGYRLVGEAFVLGLIDGEAHGELENITLY